jgi:hypothetical protein
MIKLKIKLIKKNKKMTRVNSGEFAKPMKQIMKPK